jgi:hypothetical protein
LKTYSNHPPTPKKKPFLSELLAFILKKKKKKNLQNILQQLQQSLSIKTLESASSNYLIKKIKNKKE